MPLTKAEARRAALSLKGAQEGLHFGKPAVLVQGQFLARIHDKEDAVVVIVPGGIEMRDMMLQAEAGLFYITDHYRNRPALLARLAKLDAATLRALLAPRLRQIAEKPVRKPAPKAAARKKALRKKRKK